MFSITSLVRFVPRLCTTNKGSPRGELLMGERGGAGCSLTRRGTPTIFAKLGPSPRTFFGQLGAATGSCKSSSSTKSNSPQPGANNSRSAIHSCRSANLSSTVCFSIRFAASTFFARLSTTLRPTISLAQKKKKRAEKKKKSRTKLTSTRPDLFFARRYLEKLLVQRFSHCFDKEQLLLAGSLLCRRLGRTSLFMRYN